MFETANKINMEAEYAMRAEIKDKDRRITLLSIELTTIKIESEKRYATLLDKYNKVNANYDKDRRNMNRLANVETEMKSKIIQKLEHELAVANQNMRWVKNVISVPRLYHLYQESLK